MVVGKNYLMNVNPTGSVSPETDQSSVNHLTNIGSYSKNIKEIQKSKF